MKIIAIKAEARLKRINADLTACEASELELLGIEQDLIDNGANPERVAEGRKALDALMELSRKKRALYLILHGIFLKATQVDPNVPQPRTGT